MTVPQSLKWHLPELITGFKNTESLLLYSDHHALMMDRHNNTSSSVEPAPLEWVLNISCCLWTSVFIALFVSEPEKANWLVTVGKRFNWQVIMGCDRSNKEAQSRIRPRADRTRWLMSDRFLNSIQQQCSTAWTSNVVCETMQDFLTVISVLY